MNVLRQALADYLAVRRVLGYRLARAEKLLAQFLTFVEDRSGCCSIGRSPHATING